MTWVDVEHYSHKEYVTNYFYLKTDNPFPKPQPLPFSVPVRKLHVPCLSAQSCQGPHRHGHFVRKTMLVILSCCHDFDWCWLWCRSVESLWAHRILTCLLYLIIFPVSVENGISQTASIFYLCCSLCMQGWVTLTNALLVFSISHAVLDGYEWVDGNDRTSLVIPGWSPSAKEGKLSHHPLWG